MRDGIYNLSLAPWLFLLVDAKLVGVTGKACNKGFILEEI
jgi:hypothetical protein